MNNTDSKNIDEVSVDFSSKATLRVRLDSTFIGPRYFCYSLIPSRTLLFKLLIIILGYVILAFINHNVRDFYMEKTGEILPQIQKNYGGEK